MEKIPPNKNPYKVRTRYLLDYLQYSRTRTRSVQGTARSGIPCSSLSQTLFVQTLAQATVQGSVQPLRTRSVYDKTRKKHPYKQLPYKVAVQGTVQGRTRWSVQGRTRSVQGIFFN